MYGWGGTDDWKKGGYDYDGAKRGYYDKIAADAAKKGPRTYTRSRMGEMKLVDPRGKEISSESKNPIIVGVDVTGSMADWPGEIFDRLPLIYQTLAQYRDDVELSFGAIGDATCDSYPLQVNAFGKGLSLEEHVKALACEGGGGGQISESYELYGYFLREHCKTPNATSPFLFLFGDEKFYPHVDPDQVKHYIGDSIQGRVDASQVWHALQLRFSLYLLHKPYGHGGDTHTDEMVTGYWANAIGAQRIIELPSKERAVDVMLGIIAKSWGQYGDFTKNMSGRQEEGEVKSVHHSLRHMPDAGGAKSVTRTKASKKTRSLSEMFDAAKA